MSGDTYHVVLDKDLGFCRLFRSDCEDLPDGERLWSGLGLRAGYDAMIRLNNERRPIRTYTVTSRVNPSGRVAYRLVKGSVPEDLTVHSVHYNDWPAACRALKALVAVRNEAENEARERAAAIMARVGIRSRKVPKFTDKDLRYIDWLKDSGRFAA